MEKKILLLAITVALGGFLFGFDTVVISGADLSLQQLWNRGDLFHGFVVMSSALWGTVLGAAFGGFPSHHFGRKKTLILIGFLYFISAIGSALATDPWVFAFFRLIGGLGVGASTVAAPTYITEISGAAQRGRLVALYQFNIVAGILIAFLSNYLIVTFLDNSWRLMLGIEALPALVYLILIFSVPESPRWLATVRKDDLAAEKALLQIDPKADVKSMLQSYHQEVHESVKEESIFQRRYRKSVTLAFFISFFNQFSGINAILYYAPRILQSGGLNTEDAFFSSIGIGLVNLIFTLVGLSLIDRSGRKGLMYIGSLGYIVSLFLVALSFWLNIGGFVVTVFLLVFIASHAIGQGTVIWVYIAEVFPTHLRAYGQSFGTSVHWVLAALIPALVPFMFRFTGEAIVFMFFGIMMIMQLIFVHTYMPETKGKSLEELSNELT